MPDVDILALDSLVTHGIGSAWSLLFLIGGSFVAYSAESRLNWPRWTWYLELVRLSLGPS